MCWLPWKGQVKNQFHKAHAKIVHFIYSFNPVVKCQNEAADLYSKWKNYLKREKKRPKYKVIYGGEDSVTKKMIKVN
uniref:Transcription elongation factor SPT4 n=1 Tax=Caenorhabditis tropicalis TaxID=1561998 RepID=A0A1I7UGJ8_9PELO